MARVLVWPDHHQPWGHPKAFDHLRKIRDKYKCDRVVNLGDEIDGHAFSTKWAIDPDLHSAADELALAIERLRPFYKEFKEVSVCESNHGMRIFKKCKVSGIPAAIIRRYEEILEFPVGWKLHKDIEIDGVDYSHGDSFNKTSWRDGHKMKKQSFVIGHIHANPGVLYHQNKKARYFSAQFGCLINPKMPAFSYGEHMLDKPVIGCGVVIDGEQAIFEPMNVRWL